MRKFRFNPVNKADSYFWGTNPVKGKIYTVAEIASMFGCNWAGVDRSLVKRDWEEVFGDSLVLDPFELYLEGMYEAYGGDDEGADLDNVNTLLGKILRKYRGINGR